MKTNNFPRLRKNQNCTVKLQEMSSKVSQKRKDKNLWGNAQEAMNCWWWCEVFQPVWMSIWRVLQKPKPGLPHGKENMLDRDKDVFSAIKKMKSCYLHKSAFCLGQVRCLSIHNSILFLERPQSELLALSWCLSAFLNSRTRVLTPLSCFVGSTHTCCQRIYTEETHTLK